MKWIRTVDSGYINPDKIEAFFVAFTSQEYEHPFVVEAWIGENTYTLKEFNKEGDAHNWINRWLKPKGAPNEMD